MKQEYKPARILLCLLPVFTILLFASCTHILEKDHPQAADSADFASDSTQPGGEEPAESAEFRPDQKYQLDQTLSFSVPSSWNTFMETEGDISFDPEELFFEARRLERRQYPSVRDALDAVLSVWADDYSVLEENAVSVDGKNAVRMSIEQPYLQEALFLYDAAVIETEDWFYCLYLQAENESDLDVGRYFSAILDTVIIDGESKPQAENAAAISLDEIPAYQESPYAEINGNVPFFTESECTTTAYKRFSRLDSLGRCGAAVACLGPETIPTEERGSISMIRPAGWHTVKYEGIEGNYLYNRCHLIGYQLCGENANELNLTTGTRYMNVQGMEPFESDTAYYIERTGNHVMYRVTPMYRGDYLIAAGVLMEAESVEDDAFSFCVFCYNVQPGIVIDYSTGDSRRE